MAITYFEKERIFKLDTPNSSYVIGIVDKENFVGHVYYGKKLRDANIAYLLRIGEGPFVPSENNRERVSFYDTFPMEYAGNGLGDYRRSSISVRTAGGHTAVSLFYVSHKIYAGKPGLAGLPATFGDENDCETLELLCEDPVLGLKVTLLYTAFSDVDVITRSVRIENDGEMLYLTKALSFSMDMDNRDFTLLTMHGSWARERMLEHRKVKKGFMGVESVRGESSHQEHPFMALAAGNADQSQGEVYGMHFVYSGNFIGQVELGQFDTVRVGMGIHPENFCWKLEKGESFQTPEVVLVYSDTGYDGMTHQFHELYRNHLIRSEYKDKKRPILINNWEATYFDFNTEKLLSIAKKASELGIEMLVMDDGWFGHRNDDSSSLGDWYVNEEKLNGGLKHLVDEVNKLGLKFGIWFEPEMISPDSKLYEAHPDWAIQIPGRAGSLCRNQYVLDLTRKEARDYAYESVASILRSANIEYVKWDMNRQLSDIGSYGLPADRQGELYHRYVLAVYEMQERLVTEFPHLLLENCSGGGARFDPGMLYYSPQIWCSDDTDAVERLKIQESTAMIYPLSTMGAHVSDCPNHTVGRVTPFETRGHVALAGTFGYELDITKIPEEDRQMIPKQVAMYHKYNDLVRSGDYYRIASYQENHYFDCYEVVSKDKSEALVTFVQVINRPNYKSRRITLKGLDPQKNYCLEGEDTVYAGDTLMYAGILIQNPWGDFQSKLLHFVEKK
ncbi:alpha-galactosidase [Roseburia intestinalis]|uniref:alpha-galactosidase n=1 Tax=Roseburia intestinalis TaxID=166486 RepID=UPI0022E84D47|nr:alpha-galactosidase [Roseburia intestinalis]